MIKKFIKVDATERKKQKGSFLAVHVSNTEIRHDGRILKELECIRDIPGVSAAAIGVSCNTNSQRALEGIDLYEASVSVPLERHLARGIRYFFGIIKFTVQSVLILRKLKPDIVHCHDTFSLPAGWIAKILTGCILIYDAHELESDKNGQSVFLSGATLFIERICWNRVDLLVSVSSSILQWYSDKFGPKKNILVLNSPKISKIAKMAVGSESEETSRTYFHDKYSIPLGKPIFIYLGILGKGRGIEICLQVFSENEIDAHLVFVGWGDLQEEIACYSKAYSNIHHHDPVAHDKVVSLTKHADFGLCFVEAVSLSDYFCLPNKLFEYAFAKVPVLSSNFPDIKQIVEKHSLGLCCEPNQESIKQTLLNVLEQRPVFAFEDLSSLEWETQAFRLSAAYKEFMT